jgi:hypothetical protein
VSEQVQPQSDEEIRCQPAFGCDMRDPRAPIAHAYGLMVLTLRGGRVAAITGFPDTGVFHHFGLPRTLRE